MKQQAVHDYVKKKRGFYAADGGEVPDEEEEAMPEEEAPEEPEPAPAPEPEVPEEDGADEDVGAESVPMDRNALIRKHLAQKYAQAADTSGVQAAGAARDRGNMISRVFEGLEGAARADSMAHGGAGVNHAGYQDVRNENNQNVGRAEAARQSNIQGFLRQNEMDRQVAQDGLKSDEAARKKKAADLVAARSDPTSPYSNSMRPTFQKLWGDQLEGVDVGQLSGTQMGDLATQLEKKEAVGQKRDKAKDQHTEAMARVVAAQAHTKLADEGRRDIVNTRADAKSLATATDDFKSLRKDLDSDQASSRTKIGVAAGKIAGASRVMGLADLLPPYKKAEVTQGLMTQISNGNGSLGQFEHLNAPTAEGTIAGLKQYFSSGPEAANAGGLILDNLLSLQNERDVSQGVIDKHVAKLKKSHPFAFEHPTTKAKAEEMYKEWATLPEPTPASPVQPPVVSGPGMANAAPANKIAPADLEAEMKRRGLKPKVSGASGGF